jgi:hypothetical protein
MLESNCVHVFAYLLPVVLCHSSQPTTPELETDSVPDATIYALVIATLLEGVMLALYTALVAGIICMADSDRFIL